jgi:very-short-patch-repair endonuclease
MAGVADVVEVLERLGGAATFGTLTAEVPVRALRRAVAEGAVRRVSQGVYALPESPEPLTAALARGGVVSHVSAAVHWGLWVVEKPATPHVTVPRGRRPRKGPPCTLHRATRIVALDDVTTPLRTVLDCARTLPFREAVAIADSALRLKHVTPSELREAAVRVHGPGRAKAIAVAEAADGRSESALESVLRAILLEDGLTGFEPQVEIVDGDFSVRLDLGHRGHRIAIEADGFEFHGTRAALKRDCRRHVGITVRGWILLRFSWEDVMHDPDYVLASVRAVLLAEVA